MKLNYDTDEMMTFSFFSLSIPDLHILNKQSGKGRHTYKKSVF